MQGRPGPLPKAWYFLGILAHSEGRLRRRRAGFSESPSARRPELEQAYYRLALVLADQRRGDAALQILDRARQLSRTVLTPSSITRWSTSNSRILTRR